MNKKDVISAILVGAIIPVFVGSSILVLLFTLKPIPASERVAVLPHITDGDKHRGVVTAVYNIRRLRSKKEFTQESETNLISDASKLCRTWDYSKAKLFSENRTRPGSIYCIRDGYRDCLIYQYTVNLQCVN